jgi:hypothetical protein
MDRRGRVSAAVAVTGNLRVVRGRGGQGREKTRAGRQRDSPTTGIVAQEHGRAPAIRRMAGAVRPEHSEKSALTMKKLLTAAVLSMALLSLSTGHVSAIFFFHCCHHHGCCYYYNAFSPPCCPQQCCCCPQQAPPPMPSYGPDCCMPDGPSCANGSCMGQLPAPPAPAPAPPAQQQPAPTPAPPTTTQTSPYPLPQGSVQTGYQMGYYPGSNYGYGQMPASGYGYGYGYGYAPSIPSGTNYPAAYYNGAR